MIRLVDHVVVVETAPPALADVMQLVLHPGAGGVRVLHWGAPLDDADVMRLLHSSARSLAHGEFDVDARPTLLPESGSGWMGEPGLRGRRADGSAWAPRFGPSEVAIDGESVSFVAEDEIAGLRSRVELVLHGRSVRLRVGVENLGDDEYAVDRLLTTVEAPRRAQELLHLVGRWTHEFQERRRPFAEGAFVLDHHRGRTSHDRVPALFAGTEGFTDNTGEVWAAVLGWSGSPAARAERLTDGSKVLQLGVATESGEVRLAPGERVDAPWVELAHSSRGLNGVSQALHASIRAAAHHPGPDRPRPVLLNTWEAVYFDHDLDTLCRLADLGAAVGVERFVLDDGWFHGRRNDRAGLGDWWVDPDVWPNGLEPLIEHVTSKGMEFGIWVEPEMVNPDSDLYREHPEWALVPDGYEPVLGRHQLVLDLGNPEVFDHLLRHLDALLRDHDIAYVKWDMNRDLVHESDATGAPAGRSQTLAVYRLFDELRARHPGVEIESCSSGGGRADFEILSRTERLWTSDSNDPLQRQRIQRGASILFPPEVVGAHIGPPRAHTSFRRHSLAFRATTAFFGHLGLEWNLLEMTEADRAALADVIAAHKRHRALLHGGEAWRLDTDDPSLLAHVVVADDRREALVSYAQLDMTVDLQPPPLRFAGLDDDCVYRISTVDLAGGPTGAVRSRLDWLDGTTVSGRQLRLVGLQMPLLHPESALVLHLDAR